MRKGPISYIIVLSVILLAGNVALAQVPQPPWMGFYGTVTGIPEGCTANIVITNASGATTCASTGSGSFGSPSSPLKVYGSSGDTLQVRINGQLVTTWSFNNPGAIVSKILAYPVSASPSPSTTIPAVSPSPSPSPSATQTPTGDQHSSGGTFTYLNGAFGQSEASPSPTATTSGSSTATATPTVTPTPTALPTSTQQNGQGSSKPTPTSALLVILAIGAAAAVYFQNKKN